MRLEVDAKLKYLISPYVNYPFFYYFLSWRKFVHDKIGILMYLDGVFPICPS